jgi:hypothetical protein
MDDVKNRNTFYDKMLLLYRQRKTQYVLRLMFNLMPSF